MAAIDVTGRKSMVTIAIAFIVLLSLSIKLLSCWATRLKDYRGQSAILPKNNSLLNSFTYQVENVLSSFAQTVKAQAHGLEQYSLMFQSGFCLDGFVGIK